MSAEDDNPLVRWSRRKRAARKGDAASSGTESDRHDEPVSRPPEEAKPAAKVPPSPPPSPDELTAESDLVAFLKEDVPEHLKTAALRKMWSLDPAIRDHIGLAENSWDFNRPDSIPGFGTSVASSDTLDFFSSPAPEAPPAPATPVSSIRAPQAASERSTERISRAIATPSVEEAAPSHSEPDPEPENKEPSDTARPAPSSRHGGALPRE